jgi:hypothetical protein
MTPLPRSAVRRHTAGGDHQNLRVPRWWAASCADLLRSAPSAEVRDTPDRVSVLLSRTGSPAESAPRRRRGRSASGHLSAEPSPYYLEPCP